MPNRALKKILVLGLGNPLLSDDSVGLYLIDLLKNKYSQSCSSVLFEKNYSGGIDLLYDLAGFEKAIIIDSICTGEAAPGSCHEFSVDNLNLNSQTGLIDSHGLNLRTVQEFGEKCGYTMPEITIYGIEGSEFVQFSEKLTPDVLKGLQSSIETIERKLVELCNMVKEKRKTKPLRLNSINRRYTE